MSATCSQPRYRGWPEPGGAAKPRCLTKPFEQEPDFATASVNFKLKELLLVGDLGLSAFEDKLSASWPLCNARDESVFRVVSAFYRIIESAAAGPSPRGGKTLAFSLLTFAFPNCAGSCPGCRFRPRRRQNRP